MFGRKKQDEVIVRGLDEKYIERMKEYHEARRGVEMALESITEQFAKLERIKMDIWHDLEEEYQLPKDSYRMDMNTAQIIRLAR